MQFFCLLLVHECYVFTYIPAFQASPTCGFAVFSTHEANAIQTRHISDCLRGSREASNPSKKVGDYFRILTIRRPALVKLMASSGEQAECNQFIPSLQPLLVAINAQSNMADWKRTQLIIYLFYFCLFI